MDFWEFIENVWRHLRCEFKKNIYKLRYKTKVKFGSHFLFLKGFYLFAWGSVRIGEHCFFNDYCSVNCMKKITIGDNCLFGKNVNIYDHNHKYGASILTRSSGLKTSEVFIGNNVWCGSNVTILPGVKIGNNVVIGAGCTIYKDVPDNIVVINKQDQMHKKI